MNNLVFLLVATILSSTVIVAYGEECTDSATTKLNSFLTLDADGARLKQWQAEEYLKFPDGEPGWDMSEAISSFEIVKQSCGNSRCRFEVKYNFVPMSGKQFLYDHPEGDSKTEIYNLHCIEGKWLIDGTIAPHVLQDKLLNRE
jgi:hypothetical protein